MKRLLFTATIFALALHAMAQVPFAPVLHAVEEHNLQLRALRHTHAAEQHQLAQSNVPQGLSVEYAPMHRNGYSGVAESELIVTQEVDFPTHYAARRRQGQLLEQEQEQQYACLRREVLLQAQVLCLEVVRTRRVEALIAQRQQDADAVLQLVQKQMDAGDATVLDLHRAQMEQADVALEMQQCLADRRQAMTQLRQLCGGEDVPVPADSVFPERLPIDDYEQLRLSVLHSSPSLRQAEAQVATAQHAHRQSRWAWLPSLTVGYRRNTDADLRLHGVQMGATFPLTSTRAAQHATQEQLQATMLQAEQARQEEEQGLRALWTDYTQLEQTLSLYDIPLMQRTLSLLHTALSHGQLSVLEYYAQVAPIQRRLQEHATLEHQAASLYARLTASDLGE